VNVPAPARKRRRVVARRSRPGTGFHHEPGSDPCPTYRRVPSVPSPSLSPFPSLRFLFRKRLIDQGRLLLLGVLPEYRGLGLLPLMVNDLGQRASNRKVRRVEFSWVLEDNIDINQPAEQGGARRYKTYRIYQKAIA